ncbi:LptF/LptG family permease [Chitinophagaceae bacterium MMS25-I14]
MIKKLDILLIRSYVGPFVVTFFVTLFVLVMQFFWLYMDELIGKGLGIWMILQMLGLMSTTLVPMALPLAVLLASIMTFGNMGENFELVAIKSSGISLLRFMRPLLIFIIGVSGLAFVFNNNIIPVANLKALSLLYDLRNSKPTLNIRPGQFNNDITGYSIRVGSKDKDGQTIHDIVIYDHTEGMGNLKTVLAKSGVMMPSPDKHFLIFRLQDGWRYEEGGINGNTQARTQMRMHFGQWDKYFDLSGFKLTRTSQDQFKDAYQMLNVSQLNTQIDTQKKIVRRLSGNINAYITPYVTFISPDKPGKTLREKMKDAKLPVHTYTGSFISNIPDSLHERIVQFSTSNVRTVKGLIDASALDSKVQNELLLKYDVEWHRKFTLSFACILLFLIGAPLGAIIRKGGLGMPMIIAVSFFLIWYIISSTGDKLSKTGALPPWMGMWMATGMLLPIAAVLIRQARNDSQIFTKEWYNRLISPVVAVFKSRKIKK